MVPDLEAWGGKGWAVGGFRVHGNYPNPFNPSTRIRFDLDTASDVTVEIFDVTGRRALTVERGIVPAGVNLAVDVDASSLPSRIYVYRIVAASESGTRLGVGMMTLQK